MAQINYVSKEGFEKMQKDLYEMKHVQRPFISNKLQMQEIRGI
jgi:hypothetical protein